VAVALAAGFAATAFIGRACKDKSETPAAPPTKEKTDRASNLRKWFGRAKLVVSVLKPLIEGFLAVQAAASEAHQEPSMPPSREDFQPH
jgi:hypothetical protein